MSEPAPKTSLAVRTEDLTVLSEAVIVLDRHRRVLSANEAALSATRAAFGRDLLIGASLDDFSAIGTLEDFCRDHARALAGEVVTTRRKLHYPSGIAFWWEVRYLPAYGADGAIHGVVFSAVNNTSEAEVREQLRLFERAIDAAPVGIVISGPPRGDALMLYVNHAFCEMTGYSRAELLGCNCRLLQGADREQPEVERIRAAIAAGQPTHVVLRNYRKDGTHFWNSLTLAPIHTGPDVTHYVGIQMDVTAELAARAELTSAAHAVAIGDLAAGIAHDVNNLLSVAGLNAEFLMRADDAQIRALGADLQSLVERSSGVIRKLLGLARGASSEPTAFDVRELVVETARLVRPLMAADIAVHTDLPERSAHVRADRIELERVLLNLATNARSAMPDGGELRFSVAHRTLAGRDEVVISVSDTGHGMPPEVARRVFEKFFTTRPEAGTGLGLACVHSAVRAAGGDVSVTSAVGVGTRFDVALPAVAAIASSPRELRAPLAALGHTILLAEDDELLRRWTARALRGFGYVVHEHEDGDTLLRELQTGEPVHVVIADAVTPRMGARALVESLGESMASALTHRDRPSVLVVSGHLADAPSWVSEAGARVGFLPKPYSMSELLAAIDALTSRLE